ncbi:uncharacterized protein [Hoplias malabaricus]|uniref:uncharacterized protein isoform X2 n=1 Tax=Hoplias malabaricus TaxID=27720 RepID=UPI003461A75C
MCPKDRPSITWNDGELSGSTTLQTRGNKMEARSTLKFTAKASAHGQVITCKTKFKGNIQTERIVLKVKRLMFSRDWTFSMPKTIRGVRGSCVVIPCSFDFRSIMPSNVQVKWYEFSETQYPLVYDQSERNIIPKFRGKTSLAGSANQKNCSLKIQPLELQYNQKRLYPWMDPKSIDSYHRENYYDVTIALEVTDTADKPEVNIIGNEKVGQPITLSCSVIHTCPPAPPILKLSVSSENKRDTHLPLGDGKWKLTKEITWNIREEDVSATCTVSCSSGLSSVTEVRLNPLCSFEKPKISPTQDELMEGIEKIFTCTVHHTCQKKKPILTWNYQSMPTSVATQKISTTWNTVSTLKFKAAKDDHGKMLTCTAQLSEEDSSESVVLKVKRGMSSLDWTYSMPSKIKGLQGSCLIIPCSFTFKTTMPSNVMVKWYEYSTTQYPLVFSEDKNAEVTGKFWRKTELFGSQSEGSCSLNINPLMTEHNRVRLYPWMDPKPVNTFHRENYENWVEVQVTDQADKPKLSITGMPRVGEQITVSCSVLHYCQPSPPTLDMGEGTQHLTTVNSAVQDAWMTTKQHTFKIKEDDQTVTCKAKFPGGKTSEAQISLNAQCVCEDILIEPEVADVTEGIAKNFTCEVFHSCKRDSPTISWNYADMPETVETKEKRGSGWITSSNVLFLASMEDHGKELICTAKFLNEETTMSVVLQVQKYVPKIVDPYENDTMHIYEANVQPRISALTRSCVVIPCTFNTGEHTITRLRGLWYTSTGEYVFHPGKSNVLDNFKGRTKLLGEIDEQNCTLEIDDVKAHDNGPFCFRAEKDNNKYGFNHSCVFIIMKGSPNKPEVSPLPEEMEPGKKFTISCSVTHTCPSHPPTIKWSIPTAREKVSHEESSGGQWKTTSEITFVPTGYEKEDEDLICTATFWKGKQQERAIYLPVTRYEGLRMETIGPYVLAPLFLCLLLCAVAVAGAVIYRKRVRRMPSDGEEPERKRSLWSQISRRTDGTASWITSFKKNAPERPPKPEKRRSIWSRFSRRGPDITEHNAPLRPPKPDKRRSIWSRFSRRGPDLSVGYNIWSCRFLKTLHSITQEGTEILW